MSPTTLPTEPSALPTGSDEPDTGALDCAPASEPATALLAVPAPLPNPPPSAEVKPPKAPPSELAVSPTTLPTEPTTPPTALPTEPAGADDDPAPVPVIELPKLLNADPPAEGLVDVVPPPFSVVPSPDTTDPSVPPATVLPTDPTAPPSPVTRPPRPDAVVPPLG
ncbi:MAG TPA: hypothetical protein VFE65_00975 [Pseudonocardia sp.]|nr:hypothetical protein [Pseudonocardia sp.]